MQTSGTVESRCARPTSRPSAVCGSTIDACCVAYVSRIVAIRSSCVLAPETKPEAATCGQNGVPARSKPPSLCEPPPQIADDFGIAPDDVEHVALEVRCLRDVHRRARRRVRLRGRRGPIAARAEEFVEHVVLVGREDQPPDRQPHLPRDMTGEDVAEIAGRHREVDRRLRRSRDREIALEVVDDLRGDARPVDRVDGADRVARLEFRVGADRLDDVLAIVEHALDREIVDVGIGERKHLRRLERAHPPLRRQHEHARCHACRASRIRRSCRCRPRSAPRMLSSARLREHVLEQVAQELQRDVLEGERRAVRHVQQVHAGFKRSDRA